MKELANLSIILKELRVSHKYTQKYVAERIGVKYQSYQAYELGITIPTLINFIKLSDLYEVSLDSLIGRDNIWFVDAN